MFALIFHFLLRLAHSEFIGLSSFGQNRSFTRCSKNSPNSIALFINLSIEFAPRRYPSTIDSPI